MIGQLITIQIYIEILYIYSTLNQSFLISMSMIIFNWNVRYDRKK